MTRGLAGALWAFTFVAGLAAQADPPVAHPVGATSTVAVDSIALTVGDLDRAVAFFTDVLTFAAQDEHEFAGDAHEHLEGVFGLRVRSARMRLGDETLLLRQFLAPEGRPIAADARSNDLGFQHVAIIVSDMDAAYGRLRQHRVRHASPSPQLLPAWNAAAGGIRAFYFKDDDGHVLEVLQFPPGKGDPRWQRRDALFLGIDHTAIVVRDTDASLRFWRDTLGLRVVGGSENWGSEQERLNNVFGARLRITTLRGAAGPGVELLEYLAPRDGRPRPLDLRANDLACWQTVLTTSDLDAAERALRAAHAAFTSPGIVRGCACTPPCAAGLGVADPDGHAVRVLATEDAR